MNSPRSFRTTELAKEFARQGHLVTVITPKDLETHTQFEKDHGITIQDLGQPKWKAAELKGGGVSLVARRGIKRLSNLIFQYPGIELSKLVHNALRREEGYDLLISIASPHTVHWGVASVRSKDHRIAKVWVADCGDPFMGQENDTFTPPFYFKYVEKWFCRKADYITVPTTGAIQAYYPEFHQKIKVVPQGFRFEDIKVATEKEDNSRPVFAYAGGFIPGRRDPSELLDYLVKQEKNFIFHIYTSSPNLVKPFINRSKGRIILHDFVPRTELLYKLSRMDFVVNFENVGSKQTPSKLIDYAIIKKPILPVKTGDLNTNVMEEFLKGDYSNQFTVNDPEQYRIENVAKKFLALLR